MKKKIYFALGLIVSIVILLFTSQAIISLNVKKGITSLLDNNGIQHSAFKCKVNLLTRKIFLGKLTINDGANTLRIENMYVSFNLLNILSKKNIRSISIDDATITLKNLLFPILPKPEDLTHNINNLERGTFILEELRLNDIILKTELPDGNKNPDLHLEGLIKNIGASQNTTFNIKIGYNSSFLEIKGNFNFSNWKEYFTYNLNGRNISLKVLNILERGFLPPKIRENLLSLYLKDILLLNLKGKLDINGNGEIKGNSIYSQINFLISELSLECGDNKLIENFIEKLKEKERVEMILEIDGELNNPNYKYNLTY